MLIAVICLPCSRVFYGCHIYIYMYIYIYIIYIRRPLLARGHQAAKQNFSTLNPQFLSIFHQQVRYLLFDVLQVSNLVVYCTPWMNNLPSTRSVFSTCGVSGETLKFIEIPINLQYTKLGPTDVETNPVRCGLLDSFFIVPCHC